MCFLIRYDFTKPSVAKHNILCWKMLEVLESRRFRKNAPVEVSHSYFAPFRSTTEYKLGQLYTAEFECRHLHFSGERFSDTVGEINAGLHSYRTKTVAEHRAYRKTMVGRRTYEAFPAVIPVGHSFYLNRHADELVSTGLIVFPDIDAVKRHFNVDEIGKPVNAGRFY